MAFIFTDGYDAFKGELKFIISKNRPAKKVDVSAAVGELAGALIDPKATMANVDDAMVTAGMKEATPAPEKMKVVGLDMPESEIPAHTELPIKW
jgi:hypothetical protein